MRFSCLTTRYEILAELSSCAFPKSEFVLLGEWQRRELHLGWSRDMLPWKIFEFYTSQITGNALIYYNQAHLLLLWRVKEEILRL